MCYVSEAMLTGIAKADCNLCDMKMSSYCSALKKVMGEQTSPIILIAPGVGV